ncbi:YdcF family protein [Kitasatospora sp. NBC_00315]|uniref:YdcF family protein n=1 Tax=Kitasatospora sp. NBC_00315 TaxID=2975963 RepID=UPI003247BE8B
MPAFVLAAAFFVLFGLGVRRERRRFSNAVLLGLAVAFLAIGLLGELDRLPDAFLHVVTTVAPVATAIGIGVFAALLVANGVTMIRQEGRKPANLLSLAAGLAIFVLVALLLAAVHFDSRALRAVAGTTLLVAGYVSFLLLCFLGYAFVYGRLRVRRDVDFVVVLGAGLVDGHRVPPLLASRLDRALGLHRAQAARGRPPVLLTSGGKGSDERVPESQAMAEYLLERGVPPEHVRQEDRSRNTDENLLFCRELMERDTPGYRCVVVTNNFHVFRAAVTARRAGVPGQVLGAPTAAYYWPSATLREFAAILVSYKATNLTIGALLVVFGLTAGWTA